MPIRSTMTIWLRIVCKPMAILSFLPFARPIPNDLTLPGSVFCTITIARLWKLRPAWWNAYYLNTFTPPIRLALSLRLFSLFWLFPLTASLSWQLELFMSLWNHYFNYTEVFYAKINDTPGRVGASL